MTAEPVAVAPVTEPPVPSTTPETVAAAPAEELKTPAPARSAANVRVLGTQSLFRPASTGYNFGKRLAESIALADACSAA